LAEDNQAAQKVLKVALMLLSRREHSTQELLRKLVSKGFNTNTVERQLAELQKKDLLSDRRFTESYVRFRGQKGFGPIRIQQELRQKGIEDHLIESYANVMDDQWFERVVKVRDKRFGEKLPENITIKAKQIRFLQYRGFTQDHIQGVFHTEFSD